MPKLTDRSRRERKDDIAAAAVRVLEREGLSGASIAQIIAESGRSAGAIYSHFDGKAELARYVAEHVLAWRLETVDRLTDDGGAPSPRDVMRRMLTAGDRPPTTVLLQFWAEATTEAELHDIVRLQTTAIRDTFARAVLRWARHRAPHAAEELAERTASAMVILCQGWLANSALLGWMGADEYLDAAGLALG